MKALVLSGGASKGAFTAGVTQYLIRDKAMSFDLAIGTSTGALVGGPALLGDYNYMKNVYTNVHDADIYRNSPFFQLLNVFIHVGPVGASMDPLHRLLRDYYISQGKLQALINAGKEFVATSVNVRTRATTYVSTRDVAQHKISPETFVNAVVASCSEPAFTQPMRIFGSEAQSPNKNDLFYDGGVREFLPLSEAVNRGAQEVWAISTHPLDAEETRWGGATDPAHVDLLKALGWTIGSFLEEVKRGDLFKAFVYLRLNQGKDRVNQLATGAGLSAAVRQQLLHIFDQMLPGRTLPSLHVISPTRLMPTSLEFDPAVMQNYFADGILAAEKFFADGTPQYVDTDSGLGPDYV